MSAVTTTNIIDRVKINKMCASLLMLALGLFICSPTLALTFTLSKNKDVVGSIDHVYAKNGDTMYEIARSFDLGLLELIEANPKINPKKRLIPGTEIIIPTAFILPPGPREGIVLNLAELRIYYYQPDYDLVTTHPVGIGRTGWLTPIGETKIAYKRENPTWFPPDSIRHYYANKGEILPAFIGPGPKNPLGAYAMNLAWSKYLIHGTNKPESVGLRSSSGCIRMYPEDIKSLFQITAPGTPVRVIHAPIKIGVNRNTVYIEAHEPLKEQYYRHGANQSLEGKVITIIHENDIDGNELDWDSISKAIKQTSGYPIAIGNH